MKSDLIGIAFVVDDIHKGCKLVFRYPAPPASADHVSSFHKISAPLIAKLFRPKNALCNTSFELVIEDLRFISHPVLVPRRAAPQQSNPQPSALVGTAGASALTAAPAMKEGTAVNGATAADSHLQHQRENDTTMFNVIFVLDERQHESLQSNQSLYRNDGSGTRDATDGEDGGPSSRAKDSEETRQHRHKQRIAAFRAVAAQLANGLLHEELRAGFVSKEVRELLHIRDELLQNERSLLAAAVGGTNASTTTGGSTNPSAGSSTGGSGASVKDASEKTSQNELEVDPQTLIDVSLVSSVLANDLKRVYHGLEETGTAHVVVNHWVKLSLTLTDSVSLNMQSLRPYHTLLLLTDEDTIIKALPQDHSYQLRVLITAASPLKSFQDLALETSIPIYQLFRLAVHLTYWGYGRIIDTIAMTNIYQVHPGKSLRTTSPLAMEFKRKFAPRELCEVLASFNGARRISDAVKNLSATKKVEYMHMLIWLLQHEFLLQLHRYVYLMVPSEQPPQQSPVNDDGDDNDRDNDDENEPFVINGSSRRKYRSERGGLARVELKPSIPADTTTVGFTDEERAFLDRIATPTPLFALFKRLCVYFHGQYHFEEIMWRENVSRVELRAVLNHFKDNIVYCLHE